MVIELELDWSDVRSGIPQGSVLISILFVMFINDVLNAANSIWPIFVDNTKMYHKVTSVEGSAQLQEILDNLDKWSEKWQLPFNSGKCHSMHMGDSNPRQFATGQDYIPRTIHAKGSPTPGVWQ